MSQPNAFTGVDLDRAGDGRRQDPEWVAALRADQGALAVLAGTAGLYVEGDRLGRVALADAPAHPGAEPLLLGLEGGVPLYVVDEDPPEVPITRRPPFVGAGGLRGEPAEARASQRVGLRDAATVLGQDEGGLAAYAAALVNWHRAHRFCPTCGTESVLGEGGLTRHCPHCGAEHHPRIDPVVIMLITDGDARVLLGRQSVWPARRYSCLAGFVEPGEGLEEAIAREIHEEVRVRVQPPRYLSSQPWPFPASLMLGFHAAWAGGEVQTQYSELEHADWFTREQVAAAARDDDWEGDGSDPDAVLRLPPRTAIARRLIDAWLG